MISENGLTAELNCVTACRPAFAGHDNSSVNPLIFTIHDIEDGRPQITADDTALMVGAAGSDDGIMGDAWLDKDTTQASVHFGVYPSGVAQCLPLSLGCWGAGPTANGCSIQAEQSGVAAYGTAQWLTPDGYKQLDNIAQLYAELCVHFGWPKPHWATDNELQSCAIGNTGNGFGGAVYHHDWTRNFPNDTTHTDPGANYPGKPDGPYTGGTSPQDLFMPLAVSKWLALTGSTSGTNSGTTSGTTTPTGDLIMTPDVQAAFNAIPAAVWADKNVHITNTAGQSVAIPASMALDLSVNMIGHVRDALAAIPAAVAAHVKAGK